MKKEKKKKKKMGGKPAVTRSLRATPAETTRQETCIWVSAEETNWKLIFVWDSSVEN